MTGKFTWEETVLLMQRPITGKAKVGKNPDPFTVPLRIAATAQSVGQISGATPRPHTAQILPCLSALWWDASIVEKEMASLARTNSQPTTGACTTDKESLARSLVLFNQLQLRPTSKHLGPTALLRSSSRDRGTVGTATVPQENYEGHAGEDRMGHFDKGGDQNMQVFYA